MEKYVKEQVSKEVLEIILAHYTPKLTSQAFCLFGTTTIFYYPQEDRIGNEFNTIAFITNEETGEACYLLAPLHSTVTN